MQDTLKAGAKLKDEATGIEAIVVKAPSDPGLAIRPGGPVAIGKRYTCASCGAQVLVAKAGPGELACHDTVMEIASAKPLPSSD